MARMSRPRGRAERS